MCCVFVALQYVRAELNFPSHFSPFSISISFMLRYAEQCETIVEQFFILFKQKTQYQINVNC